MVRLVRARHIRFVVLISSLVAVLLAVRFSASTALAGMELSEETLEAAGKALEIYEILLPFPLLGVVLFLVLSREPQLSRPGLAGAFSLHILALSVWLLMVAGGDSQAVRGLFPSLAAAAVITSSALCLRPWTGWRALGSGWRVSAFLAFLILVPIVFTMRVLASLGIGTSPGTDGELRGNWIFVNLPTLLLELLAIGVWLNLLMDRTPGELRRRWFAFLPFLTVPALLVGAMMKPLSGYILSALISWGSNLALFSPAQLSLTLATTALSCYLSSLLLVGREGSPTAWNLLLIGSASVVLAGFYPSMASVEGLGVAVLVVATSISVWTRTSEGAPSPES